MILLSPVIVPAGALLIIAMLPLMALQKTRAWLFPPRPWHPWFAWRPVRCNDWFDDDNYGSWFWLETVERWRGDPDQVEYRAAQRIEAGTDETLQAAQPEGREPGPKDAP